MDHTVPEHYDARRNPNRGVRVRPLPKRWHSRFRQFCRELQQLADSHHSTIRLATREDVLTDQFNAHAIYWRSVKRFINYLEYLGTSNDSASRASRH